MSDDFVDMTGYNREEINGINCRFLQVRLRDVATITPACAAVALCFFVMCCYGNSVCMYYRCVGSFSHLNRSIHDVDL